MAAQRAATSDDDPLMLVAREIAILAAPQEVTIDYADVANNRTRRTIQIRRYDGYYIGAYCLLRRAFRTFVVTRVQDAFDQDGVSIGDFPGFLDVFYGEDSLEEEARERQRYWRFVVNNVAPEALLLRLVAASDGNLAVAENEVIMRHCLTMLDRRDAPADERKAVGRFIRRLSGTGETVARALQAVSGLSRLRRKRFGEACLAVVEADGHISDEELEMLRYFEQQGVL